MIPLILDLYKVESTKNKSLANVPKMALFTTTIFKVITFFRFFYTRPKKFLKKIDFLRQYRLIIRANWMHEP